MFLETERLGLRKICEDDFDAFCISRHYRRQGLMEEAVRAVVARLFEEDGETIIAVENILWKK